MDVLSDTLSNVFVSLKTKKVDFRVAVCKLNCVVRSRYRGYSPLVVLFLSAFGLISVLRLDDAGQVLA